MAKREGCENFGCVVKTKSMAAINRARVVGLLAETEKLALTVDNNKNERVGKKWCAFVHRNELVCTLVKYLTRTYEHKAHGIYTYIHTLINI